MKLKAMKVGKIKPHPAFASQTNNGIAARQHRIAVILRRRNQVGLSSSFSAMLGWTMVSNGGLAFPSQSKISQHMEGCSATRASQKRRAWSRRSKRMKVQSVTRGLGTPSGDIGTVVLRSLKKTAHWLGETIEVQSGDARAWS